MSFSYTSNWGLAKPVFGTPGTEWYIKINNNFDIIDSITNQALNTTDSPTFNDLFVLDDLSVGDELNVTNDIIAGGQLSANSILASSGAISNNFSVGNDLNINGDFSLLGEVLGDLNLRDGLNVDGTAVINILFANEFEIGNFTIDNLSVLNSFNVGGNSTLNTVTINSLATLNNRLQLTGHVAIGNNAIIDPSYYSNTTKTVVNINETATDSNVDQHIALISWLTHDSTASIATSFISEMVVPIANSIDQGILTSAAFNTKHFGSGAVSQLLGITSEVRNINGALIDWASSGYFTFSHESNSNINLAEVLSVQGGLNSNGFIDDLRGITIQGAYANTGIILQNYGMYIEQPSTISGGIIQSSIGLYIENQNISDSTDSYNIYSAGANSINLFEGNLIVNGDLVIDGAVNYFSTIEEYFNTTEIYLTESDFRKTIVIDSTSETVVYLPSVTASEKGAQIRVVKLGPGKVTVIAANSDVIADSSPGGSIYNDEVTETYANLTFLLVRQNQWVIWGHGTWTTT